MSGASRHLPWHTYIWKTRMLIVLHRWSMAWQDSHFSLSYDRPSTTAVGQPNIAYRADSQPGERSYFETLTRIISLVLEVVRGRMLTPNSQLTFKSIQAYKESIQQIWTEAKPHLRDRKYCLTATQHLERVVLKLHASYFTSELCRPGIKPTADLSDPTISRMRTDCISNLMATVEAYVEMHAISSHASRSWITMQRAVSSAFLLAVIEEAKMDSRIWTLLRQLEGIIAERAHAERDFETTTVQPTNPNMQHVPQGYEATNPSASNISPTGVNTSSPIAGVSDPQTQWAKPLTKTLRALQKLNAAFSTQTARSAAPNGSSVLYQTSTTGASPSTLGSRVGPVPSGLTPTTGSLPPPTPESSTSGEWTVPNIMDRAAEYIHPPLWG